MPVRWPSPLVLLLAALLTTPVIAGTPDNRNACLRVLTYNVHGLTGPVPDDVIVGAVQALNADLIGMQEVFSVRGVARLLYNDARGTLERALREAGYETYWSSYAGASPDVKPWIDPWLVYEPGNLLAVRRNAFRIIEPASETQLSRYPRAFGLGRENRVLQHVGLRWRGPDRRIDFYNTHLTHRGRRSDEQDTPLMDEVRRIRQLLEPRGGGGASILLTADINLTPSNRGYRLLIEGSGAGPALIDTWHAANPGSSPRPATLDPDNTFFSKYSFLEKLTGDTHGPPPLHLDFVFLGPAEGTPLSVRSSRVVLDQRHEGSNYSDHYGVLSEVCLARD